MKNLILQVFSGSALLCFLFILICSTSLCAQPVPKTIRGYKVHKETILVVTEETPKNLLKTPYVIVGFGEPRLSGLTRRGLTFSIDSKIEIFGQDGTIDAIEIESISINERVVSVGKIKGPIKFGDGKQFFIKDEIFVNVGAISTFRAALDELSGGRETWRIRGKANVFGKFRKAFLRFKRVVPVEFDITIPNPVR